ncbi:hypothetical protein D9M72_581720 [compost metagenome]
MAVLPLHIFDVPLARGADPGAHDLAAVFTRVGVEVDGVRVAFEFFPFAGVEHGQRVGIAKYGNRCGHDDSGQWAQELKSHPIAPAHRSVVCARH